MWLFLKDLLVALRKLEFGVTALLQNTIIDWQKGHCIRRNGHHCTFLHKTNAKVHSPHQDVDCKWAKWGPCEAPGGRTCGKGIKVKSEHLKG